MPARMFVAVVPPEPVAEALDEFLEPRRDADDRLRWTPRSAWHVTTAFCASVGEDHVERLVENLRDAAVRTPAFDVRLAGGGAFPSPFDTHVLWLGALAGADELVRLASRTRTAAERAGVSVDGARFVPHLTLARTRRPFNATRWLGVLDSFEGASWRVGEIRLVESHLRDRGRRYETVGTFALDADA